MGRRVKIPRGAAAVTETAQHTPLEAVLGRRCANSPEPENLLEHPPLPRVMAEAVTSKRISFAPVQPQGRFVWLSNFLNGDEYNDSNDHKTRWASCHF